MDLIASVHIPQLCICVERARAAEVRGTIPNFGPGVRGQQPKCGNCLRNPIQRSDRGLCIDATTLRRPQATRPIFISIFNPQNHEQPRGRPSYDQWPWLVAGEKLGQKGRKVYKVVLRWASLNINVNIQVCSAVLSYSLDTPLLHLYWDPSDNSRLCFCRLVIR